MKALQYNQYGGPDVLHWADMPTPTPANGQVLVAVKAASLNPTDAKIRHGWLRFPGSDAFPKVMGLDFAGVVAQVGPDVNGLKEGDKVMGYTGATGGSFAEFVLTNAADTFRMPDNLDFAEATTLPMNAATALKVVNNYLKPTAEKSILVNGAAGGLGLFVVQYCKNAGATVTGTATGPESLRILKDLGADEVIDYKATDILQSGKTFDAILDTSGKLDFEQAKAILNEGGEFSTMVPKGDPNKEAGRTDGSKKELLVFAIPGPDEFKVSQAMAADGKIRAVVGVRFPMQQAQEAQRQFEGGQLNLTGKAVLIA